MANQEGIKQIIDIQAHMRELQAQLEQAIREELPVGTEVTYDHGDHEIMAEVTGIPDHGSWVWVTGTSGKAYRMDVARLTGAWRKEVYV